MIKIIILLIFYNLSFGDIFTLSNKEKRYIKSLPDKRVVAKRFSNFYKFTKKAKTYNLQKKLMRTNFHINRIISKGDGKNSDTWASPKEFLINGYGDCEDYAIAKYFTLVRLGIDKEKLFLCTVKVKNSVDFHMVLIYKDRDDTLLVLDNLSWKILPLHKRKNIDFVLFAFNDKSSYSVFENRALIQEFGIKREEVKIFRKISSIR